MYATLAVINAVILTMDNDVQYSAMAVIEERIVALGTYDDIVPYIGKDTHIVDGMGACVLPGLIDTQVNLLDSAFFMDARDLSYTRTKEQAVQQLKKHIIEKDIKEKQWIFGYGSEFVNREETDLSQKDLNRISMHHPILLLGRDKRSAVLNDIGMKRLHMKGHNHIIGRRLEWLKGNIFSHYGIEELKENIIKTSAHLSKQGITSIHTDDQFGFGYRGRLNDLYRAYEQLTSENKLSLRIYHQIQLRSEQELKEQLDQPFRSGDGNAWFKLGAIKLYTDRELFHEGQLNTYIETCHKNGFQLSLETKGIEDLASYKERISKLSNTHNPDRKLRHILLLKEEGVGITIEDSCLISSYNHQQVLQKKTLTIFERMREISVHNCYGLNKETTAKDLLSMFTINAARSEYSEAQKGSLKRGKLADFILVDKNPLEIPLEDLGAIQVKQTYVNGKCLYSS